MKDNIRKEFVNSIINTLKIENNVFNNGLVDDLINHIEVNQYRTFYNELFGEDKRYMNGLDRVKEVSIRYSNFIKYNEVENIRKFVGKVLSLEDIIKEKGMPKSLKEIIWNNDEKFEDIDIQIICNNGGILKMIELLKSNYGKTIKKIEDERGRLKNIKVKAVELEWK
jgi:hypothetical protein